MRLFVAIIPLIPKQNYIFQTFEALRVQTYYPLGLSFQELVKKAYIQKQLSCPHIRMKFVAYYENRGSKKSDLRSYLYPFKTSILLLHHSLTRQMGIP